jgi:hypothetical protein
MEQRHPNQQQTDQWRAALLAPLGREATQVAEATADQDIAVSPDDERPADEQRDGLAAVIDGQQDESPAPGEERTRVIAKVGMKESLANVYHDPIRHTVTLLLDEQHATAVICAVRALAADYEAHAQEVRGVAATMPADTYGHANRQFIAIRHERLASRLRRVESNYRTEVSEGGRPAE